MPPVSFTPAQRAAARASRYVRALVLVIGCAGCAAGKPPPQTQGPATGAALREGRPVVCLPPRPPNNALAAGPYALCAEYRAGRIEAEEHSAALEGYGDMLVVMAALDTLDQSPGGVGLRAEVVERLRKSATLRTLCAAPSVTAFGTLAECALPTDQRGRGWSAIENAEHS